MGFFSAIGKALKGVGKVVGGVAKGALSIATGGASDTVLGVFSKRKTRKASMDNVLAAAKQAAVLDISNRLGVSMMPVLKAGQGASPGVIMSASPVLPGGATVTPSGIANAPPRRHPATGRHVRTAGNPGHGRASPTHRRRRKPSASRARRRGSRKLKFGSPAWQRKYNPRARARGRRKSRR